MDSLAPRGSNFLMVDFFGRAESISMVRNVMMGALNHFPRAEQYMAIVLERSSEGRRKWVSAFISPELNVFRLKGRVVECEGPLH